MPNSLRKWLCCIDTNNGNWQDVQNSWGRQGVLTLLCAGSLRDFTADL